MNGITQVANMDEGYDAGLPIPGKQEPTIIFKLISEKLTSNIQLLDLSGQKLTSEDFISVTIPFITCMQIDLSSNTLKTVPNFILDHENLKWLNLSHNEIEYFEDKPASCHSLEHLDLSHNNLLGPPYWVWIESPKKLKYLNMNQNKQISKSFLVDETYFEELLAYKVPVEHIEINNCCLKEFIDIISTFSFVKTLALGTDTYSPFINHIKYFPNKSIEKCHNIVKLILSNTKIYNIEPSINIFHNIVELNLASNYISHLPKEFCDLEMLEICTLSNNEIIYLPEDFTKLKLKKLFLDSNSLCMLPQDFDKIISLETLDLYNNALYEKPESICNIKNIDLAQNYFEEPEDSQYLKRKNALRKLIMKLNEEDRLDGRKIEISEPPSEHSTDTDCEISSDEEEKYNFANNIHANSNGLNASLTEEDWDSDEYWVPTPNFRVPRPQNTWLVYVQKKIKEGNFCPIDLHALPIVDQIRSVSRKNCVYGQFDDLTEDETD